MASSIPMAVSGRYGALVIKILVPVFLAIGVGFLYFSGAVDLSRVADTVTGFSSGVMLSALALALSQVLSQSSRLWFLLAPERRIGWKEVFPPFALGQATNLFLPGRVGDGVKVLALSKVPGRNAVSLAEAAGGVFVADKLVDLAGLLLLLVAFGAMGWKEMGELPSLPLRAIILVAGGVGALLIALYFFAAAWFRKSMEVLRGVLRGTSALAKPRWAAGALLASLAGWVTEAWIMQLLCSAAGVSLSFSGSIWVLMILNLGIAIPISLANLGTFEAAMAFGLGRFGLPLAEALGVAAVHHFIQLVAVLLAALAASWFGGKTTREGDR